MKALFRSAIVQAILTGLMSVYLRLCQATLRWTVEGEDQAEIAWASKAPIVLCFWHSRITLAPLTWPAKRVPVKAMISLSPDGQFITDSVESLGIGAIRGSSTKKNDPAKAKGGAKAFRDALRWLRGNNACAITPDGPRGPKEFFAEGACLLAKTGPAQTLMWGMAASPSIRLKGWDHAMIPVPFGRAASVFMRLDPPSDDLDAEAMAELRAAYEQHLKDVTRRAETLLGLKDAA